MTRGERLKELRTKLDRTLEEVGRVVDISKQNLYKYENDIITNIPSDKIEALAAYYNVSPAYLMGWDIEKVNNGYVAQEKESGNKYHAVLNEITKEISEEELIDIIKYAEFLLSKHK